MITKTLPGRPSKGKLPSAHLSWCIANALWSLKGVAVWASGPLAGKSGTLRPLQAQASTFIKRLLFLGSSCRDRFLGHFCPDPLLGKVGEPWRYFSAFWPRTYYFSCLSLSPHLQPQGPWKFNNFLFRAFFGHDTISVLCWATWLILRGRCSMQESEPGSIGAFSGLPLANIIAIKWPKTCVLLSCWPLFLMGYSDTWQLHSLQLSQALDTHTFKVPGNLSESWF